MAKMRVRELAKELDIKSADIVTALSEKGVEVLPASSIEDDNIEYVKKKFAQKGDGTSSDEDAKKIIIAAHEAGVTDIRKMCISINDDLEALPVRIR